jgi:DNA/RNA-binding domain of Phe-tRNA-synthetase-like protein
VIVVWFRHVPGIWARFPELVPVVAAASQVTADADVDAAVEAFSTRAARRLEGRSESELPEIQAWRRAFTRMGLKPTQYRCASEALLRRFRRDGALPRIHPLVDLCNAVSIAYAIPIAVFDLARVEQHLEVRPADGNERYAAFNGDEEHPAEGEIIFADAAGQAHARRWTNRQSRLSAVGPGTTDVLIVGEALHATARDDMPRLLDELTDAIAGAWGPVMKCGVLTAAAPRFDL